MKEGDAWTARAFKALDSVNKGYLVKEDILSMIRIQGVYDHHYIQELIKKLESK